MSKHTPGWLSVVILALGGLVCSACGGSEPTLEDVPSVDTRSAGGDVSDTGSTDPSDGSAADGSADAQPSGDTSGDVPDTITATDTVVATDMAVTDASDADASDVDVVRRVASLELGGPLPAGSHGFAMAPDGTIWASDTYDRLGAGANGVYVDPPPYGELEASGVTGLSPTCIVADSAGIWLCDIGAAALRRIEEGVEVTRLSANAPWTVLPTATGGWLNVSYADLVEEIAPDGTSTTLFAGLAAPFGGALDPSGELWVSEQLEQRVALRSRDGRIVREVSGMALVNPEGLGFDQDGDLWIADTGGERLVRVDASTGVVVDSLVVDGLPIVLTHDPSDGSLLVSVTGAVPAWYRLRLE